METQTAIAVSNVIGPKHERLLAARRLELEVRVHMRDGTIQGRVEEVAPSGAFAKIRTRAGLLHVPLDFAQRVIMLDA